MPRKGVTNLVDAVAEATTRLDDDPVLVIAGDRDLDSDYVTEVESHISSAGISEQVRFTGYVPDAALPTLYHIADLFVLASLEEGFGMTVTEAMAAGTPVVSTDVGGVSMQLRDGRDGRLVPPGDNAVFAEALVDLLAEENERQRMSENARERAKTFSWKRITEKFIQAYREVNT
jgi:glycosyltransferase involved in cell wall biosynthesis